VRLSAHLNTYELTGRVLQDVQYAQCVEAHVQCCQWILSIGQEADEQDFSCVSRYTVFQCIAQRSDTGCNHNLVYDIIGVDWSAGRRHNGIYEFLGQHLQIKWAMSNYQRGRLYIYFFKRFDIHIASLSLWMDADLMALAHHRVMNSLEWLQSVVWDFSLVDGSESNSCTRREKSAVRAGAVSMYDL